MFFFKFNAGRARIFSFFSKGPSINWWHHPGATPKGSEVAVTEAVETLLLNTQQGHGREAWMIHERMCEVLQKWADLDGQWRRFLDVFVHFARTFFKHTRFPKKLVERQCGRTPFGVHVFDDGFLWSLSQAHWNHSIGPTCPGQLPKSMLLV